MKRKCIFLFFMLVFFGGKQVQATVYFAVSQDAGRAKFSCDKQNGQEKIKDRACLHSYYQYSLNIETMRLIVACFESYDAYHMIKKIFYEPRAQEQMIDQLRIKSQKLVNIVKCGQKLCAQMRQLCDFKLLKIQQQTKEALGPKTIFLDKDLCKIEKEVCSYEVQSKKCYDKYKFLEREVLLRKMESVKA